MKGDLHDPHDSGLAPLPFPPDFSQFGLEKQSKGT